MVTVAAPPRLARYPCPGSPTIGPGRTLTLGAALLTAATLLLLRAFLPGLLLVQPPAGGLRLPAAVAVSVVVLCLVPLAGALAVPRHPRVVWAGSVQLAAIALLALVPSPSGQLLTVIAGLGSAAGLLGLVALAGTTPAPRDVRLGILGGLAAEGLVRTATGGLGLLWSGTVAAGLLAVLLAAALLGLARSRAFEPTAEEAATRPLSPALVTWGWLLPAVVLTGALTGVPGRIAVATGWTSAQAASATATSLVLTILAALLAPRLPASRLGPVAAALVLVGTAASLPVAGWPAVLGPPAAAIGVGAFAGIVSPRDRRLTPQRRAIAPALPLAGAMAILLAYELAPSVGLPANVRPLLLLAVALGAAALAVVAGRPAHTATVRGRLQTLPMVTAVLVGAATVAAVTLLAPAPLHPLPAGDSSSDHLEVATFAVSAGFRADGRYDPGAQAQLLRDHEVDLVLLTGVDRGSWLAGGQDLLPLLHAGIGLEHVIFAPAAGELTGHALLSRYPITEFATEPLPGGTRSAVHSQLVAVVTLPEGAELGVIGTALAVADGEADARLPQARAVAGNVARLRERSLPTVLLGDLGGPLEGAVQDSFDPLLPGTMPDGAMNFPATDPTELRDHVLLSEDLRRAAIAIPAEPASTHLPVVVTVEGVAVRP